MPIWFQSFSDVPIWIAYAWQQPSCPEGLNKTGWYQIPPLALSMVNPSDLREWTGQGTFLWIAQAENTNGPWWSGDWYLNVTHEKFNQCLNDNAGCDVPIPFNNVTIQLPCYGFTIGLLGSPGTFGQPNQGACPLLTYNSTSSPYVPIPPPQGSTSGGNVSPGDTGG